MKTMIPAAAGTLLLVPFMHKPDEIEAEMGAEPAFDLDVVPVLGWMNFAENAGDNPGIRTAATPVVPYWPNGVSQAAGYLIPRGGDEFTVSVPFAKRTFYGANARSQYEHFAESVVRGMEEERNQEDSVSGDMGQREPADLQAERREDRDEGGVSFLTKRVVLEAGVFAVTAEEDAREYGKTAVEGGQRRTKEEIKADEAYLTAIESTGKTIRAANTRWKTFGSRTAVLADLAGLKEGSASGDGRLEDASDGDDEDLIG